LSGVHYQAESQAAAQHRQWLRQLLRATYAEFIASVEQPYVLSQDAMMRLATAEWREAGAICERIDLTNAQKALAARRVEAPESVVQSAEQAFAHLRRTSLQLQLLADLLQRQVVEAHEMPTVDQLLSGQRAFESQFEALLASVLAGCRASLQGHAIGQ
jgi:hypothetical protein